jgi:hypothetical protein
MKEWVVEVNKTRLISVAIGMRVATVILSMAAVIAQCATLQQFALVGKMASLVIPLIPIGYLPIVRNPRLTDKPFSFQYFHC